MKWQSTAGTKVCVLMNRDAVLSKEYYIADALDPAIESMWVDPFISRELTLQLRLLSALHRCIKVIRVKIAPAATIFFSFFQLNIKSLFEHLPHIIFLSFRIYIETMLIKAFFWSPDKHSDKVR